MTKYIIIIAIVIIGGWFLVKSNYNKPAPETITQTLPTNNTEEKAAEPTPAKSSDTNMNTTATLHTNKGDIKIELYEKDAPNTVANFVKLAKAGFYDGVKFHRVIKGFMDQTGDPLSKDDSKMAFWGTGDPGYKFADEINAQSDLYKTGYKKGVVAMANSGPNTNGSQFFIMALDYPLPPLYTIFGHVVVGQDVVDAINNTPTGPNDRPVSAVVINSISVQ